jgi:hypothetical protein
MKKALNNIKEFFKKILPYLKWIGLGILIFIGVKRYEKNDTRSASDITDPIIRDNVTKFRNRSEQVVRGLFSDRGYTNDPGNSGGTNQGNGTGNNQGSSDSVGSEKLTNSETRKTSDNLVNDSDSSGSNRGNSSARNNFNPIDDTDEGFLNFVEGPLIKKYGSHLFCLLAPMQIKFGRLVSSEIVDIYNQARKDPAIMDRYCTMGNKDYLVTYDAKMYLGIFQYLVRCTKQHHEFAIYEYNVGETKEHKLTDNTGKELFRVPKKKTTDSEFSQVFYYKWST